VRHLRTGRFIVVVADPDTALIVDLATADMILLIAANAVISIAAAVLLTRVTPADPLAVAKLCSASARVAL
jgi:hypothetical protein